MKGFERFYHVMVKPYVVLFVAIMITASFLYADRPIAEAAHVLSLGGFETILQYVSDIGKSVVDIVVLFALALFFRFVYKNKLCELRVWFIWVCVLSSNIICTVLKAILGRARPELLFSENLYGFYGFQKNSSFWSFPSGHTMTIMALIFALGSLFPRYFLMLLLLGLGLSGLRVLLCYHYLSDVIVASYLSLLIVGILHQKLIPLLFKKPIK